MNDQNQPRVSVGLPVYNGERYLRLALDSLLAQTFGDFEVVVSDNASTDETAQILADYVARDPRVVVHTQAENRGGSWNHNFVFARSRGAYFKWYSYDDLLAPTHLEVLVDALDRDPGVVLAFPQAVTIDADGEVVSNYRTDLPWQGDTPSARVRNLLGHPLEETLLHMCQPELGLMRREVLASTGLIRPYNSSDEVLLVEMALRGRWMQVPQRLFLHRRHPQSTMLSLTPLELAQWYDPQQNNAYPMALTRRSFAFLRCAATAPISLSERMRSLGIVVRWLVTERHWRIMIGEIRIRGKQVLLNSRIGRT